MIIIMHSNNRIKLEKKIRKNFDSRKIEKTAEIRDSSKCPAVRLAVILRAKIKDLSIF
jgi:DNA gyrase/topoisomerase IV subunit A